MSQIQITSKKNCNQKTEIENTNHIANRLRYLIGNKYICS